MSSVGVGTAVSLVTTATDTAGAAVDPVTVELFILLPDGTEAGPFTWEAGQVVKEAVGRFSYRYLTTQPGQHIARWETAIPTAVDEEPFDVEPRWREAGIVSLADVKSHLKKRVTDTADDAKLQEFIGAATDLIEDRMGRVVPVTITEDVFSRGDTIVLRERPVIEIVSVTRYPGGTLLPAHDVTTLTRGWRLTSAEGVLETSGRFPGDMRIVYRAGRQPVPRRFRMAGKELTAHLWRTSQLNQEGGRPQAQGDTQVPASSYALPYNVRQLLGLDRQSRDMPVVG
jgi:hypothetical protein